MDRSAFLARLNSLSELSEIDRDVIRTMPMSIIRINRRRQILSHDVRPSFVYVLLSGWAARYDLRRDGSRRITGIMLPGDFCGIHAVCGAVLDHAIIALTDCVVGMIEQDVMAAATRSSDAIYQGVWRAKFNDEAILRKWLLNSVDARLAVGHLLCELYSRAQAIGLAEGGRCPFPLTQEEIGDAMGLTGVHINRVLRRLREAGLADISNHELIILNAPGLRHVAEFDPGYLAPWQHQSCETRSIV